MFPCQGVLNLIVFTNFKHFELIKNGLSSLMKYSFSTLRASNVQAREEDLNIEFSNEYSSESISEDRNSSFVNCTLSPIGAYTDEEGISSVLLACVDEDESGTVYRIICEYTTEKKGKSGELSDALSDLEACKISTISKDVKDDHLNLAPCDVWYQPRRRWHVKAKITTSIFCDAEGQERMYGWLDGVYFIDSYVFSVQDIQPTQHDQIFTSI